MFVQCFGVVGYQHESVELLLEVEGRALEGSSAPYNPVNCSDVTATSHHVLVHVSQQMEVEEDALSEARSRHETTMMVHVEGCTTRAVTQTVLIL